MSKRGIIYTAIFGDYDTLLQPVVRDRSVDYVCFTDRQIKSPGIWQVRVVDEPYSGAGPSKSNRYYKINSHLLFPDADVTIYHDGNMTMKVSFESAVGWLHQSSKLLLVRPPKSSWSLADERDAVVDRRLAAPERARAQVDGYIHEGVDPKHPGVRCGLMIRRQCQELADFERIWWDEIRKHTHRDQLSFPYAAMKSGLRYQAIPFGERSKLVDKIDHAKPRDQFGQGGESASPLTVLPVSGNAAIRNAMIQRDHQWRAALQRLVDSLDDAAPVDDDDGSFAYTVITEHSGDDFGRLAGVLRKSIARNCPGARMVARRYDMDESASEPLAAHNTEKLRRWRDAVHEHEGNIVFLDADTLVLKDLAPAFQGDFDLSLTTRPGTKRINAGVVFVKANANSRRFFDRWVEENDRIMSNPAMLADALLKHGGVNQASLLELLNQSHGSTIAELPCKIWNSVDQTWAEFDADTRVLHIKGKLRDSILNDKPPHRTYTAPLIDLWREYERSDQLTMTA
jgi:hypothetical protein